MRRTRFFALAPVPSWMLARERKRKLPSIEVKLSAEVRV